MPNLFKKCVKCEEMRNADTEYHLNGAYYKGGIKKRRTDCVYCCRKRRSEYFKNADSRVKINTRRRRNYQTDGGARREKNRKNSLKQLYGMSVERYDELRKEQNYSCGICKIHESKAIRGKLYVDHNHITGENRGLLCSKCNSALGFFLDSPEIMKRAIDFISRTRS